MTVRSIGVTSWTLPDAGKDAPRVAAEMGFAHLHVDMNDAPNLDAARDLRRAANRSGITLAALSLSAMEADGPGAIDPALTAQIAKALGVEMIYLPCFGPADPRSEAVFSEVSALLSSLHGVFDGLVAVETLMGAADLRRLVEGTGDPRSRVLFDTQNPTRVQLDPRALGLSLLDILAPDIHLKDGVTGLGDRAVGDGTADVLATLTALQRRGWRGRVTLETDYSAGRLFIGPERDRLIGSCIGPA